jgi:hypothetical protein
MLVIGMGLSILFNTLVPGLAAEYVNPVLFRPWSDPLMNLYYAYPFILGIVLAWGWNTVKSSLPGTPWQRGFKFGFGYWILAGLPGMWMTYSSFQVSLLMVLSWSLVGLLQGLVASWVLARMNA